MYANMIHMVLHMMFYIYSHCRTEGRWLTGVNLQVRTSTLFKVFVKLKKTLKALSSRQKTLKKPKNPKKPKKPKKNQKNPKKTHWAGFFL
jgi:hypothetical protein